MLLFEEAPGNLGPKGLHDSHVMAFACAYFPEYGDFDISLEELAEREMDRSYLQWNKDLADYALLGLHDAHVIVRLDMRNAEAEEIPF